MKMSRRIFALLLAVAVMASSTDLFSIGGASGAQAAEMTDPAQTTAVEQNGETQADGGEQVDETQAGTAQETPAGIEEPAQEVPGEAIDSTQEAPDGTDNPTQKVPGEANSPTQETPDGATDPTQTVPDGTADPTQTAPDGATDPTQTVPDGTDKPTQEAPDGITDPSQTAPNGTTDPAQTVPVEQPTDSIQPSAVGATNPAQTPGTEQVEKAQTQGAAISMEVFAADQTVSEQMTASAGEYKYMQDIDSAGYMEVNAPDALNITYLDEPKCKGYYIVPASGKTEPRAPSWGGLFSQTSYFVYDGKSVLGIPGPNPQTDISNNRRYRTVNNIQYYIDPCEMVLGRGIKFANGFGVLPSPSGKEQQYVLFDVTGNDKFYSVAGITGTAFNTAEGNANRDNDVIYEVWGSPSAPGDADFESSFGDNPLARSGAIKNYNTAEFDVDIRGIKTLKLVAKIGSGTNAGTNSLWGNPCVYKLATSFTTSISWSGDDDTTDKRPDKVMVQLTINGTESNETEHIVSLTAEKNWTHTWNNLPQYDDNGAEYTYGVKVLYNKYDMTVGTDGTITANLEGTEVTPPAPPETTNITASVTWDHGSNGGADQPTETTVLLYADSVPSSFATLSSPSWSHTWSVPKKNDSGTDIIYTVRQGAVPNYAQNGPDESDSVDGGGKTFTFTNTYVPPSGNEPTPPEPAKPESTYTVSPDGSYTGVTKARDGKVTYLSDQEYLETQNSKTNLFGTDTIYSGTDKIKIGEKGIVFEKGLGVHPKTANSGAAAYTIYDVSNLNADRFYAAVGITNAGGQTNGLSLIFKVCGDKEGNGNYEPLKESDLISGKASGEFDVDITGIKKLKLELLCTSSSISSGGSAWANACVYQYDENGSAPVAPLETTDVTATVNWDHGSNPATDRPKETTMRLYADGKPYAFAVLNGTNGSHTWSGLLKYNGDGKTEVEYTVSQAAVPNYSQSGPTVSEDSAGGGKTFAFTNTYVPTTSGNEPTTPDPSKPESKYTSSSDGSYIGVTNARDGRVTYLSDQEYLETQNSKTNLFGTDTIYSGTAKIKIGEKGIVFEKGLGVHPKTANSGAAAYTIYDVSNLNADRFYAAVGITNAGGQTNGLSLVFQVSGDKEGDGNYQLLKVSEKISGKASGEFDVDITGIKKLKLELLCTSSSISSGGSAWANACVYQYDENGSAPVAPPETTGVTATVKWDHGSNPAESRPKETTVLLYADGEPYSFAALKGTNGSHTWSGLLKYKADGNAITYTVSQAPVPDYKQSVDSTGKIFTNTYIPPSSSGDEPTPPAGPEQADAYTSSQDGSYTGVTKAGGGKVTYLSDLDYLEAYNASKADNTGKDQPYGGSGNFIIGQADASFSKGLGVHPKEPGATPAAYTTYDLSTLDVDRFYAALGITNSNGRNGIADARVVYKVYGDKGDGTFVFLAESGEISRKASGELNVDISGMKKLKLEIVCSGSKNASCGSAWANACVYKYDENGSAPGQDDVKPVDPDASLQKDAYRAVEGGNYRFITRAKGGKVTYLSDLDYQEAYNSSKSDNTGKDVVYGGTDKFIIGEADVMFRKGLGVHPKGPGAVPAAYTIYDLTNLDADRFYAAVGITNAKGRSGEADAKVTCQVYGDKGDGIFLLLAKSDVISRKTSGELNVDISGMKKLKLEIVCSGASNASSASAWAAACVYQYDENGSAPARVFGEDTSEIATQKNAYTAVQDGKYGFITRAKDGNVTYLSDLKYKEALNSASRDNTTGNTVYGGSGKIVIGYPSATFSKGLGVHPAPPANGNAAYTLYDVSGLNVDRFYAALGITNANGRSGKADARVVYKVYGDYGDGMFQLLAESDVILQRTTGELNVDITDVKMLKLVIVCAGDTNASSASAWAGACVYRYAEDGKAPENIITIGRIPDQAASEIATQKDAYSAVEDGKFEFITSAEDGKVTYLSDLSYQEALNNTTANNTTKDEVYGGSGRIVIGYPSVTFRKGLGVHPAAPSAAKAANTIYDVSGLDVDRFYAAVGITNTNGRSGKADSRVVYKVYGDYGDGMFQLLTESDVILRTDTGEMNVDITGVKILKLTIICAGDSNASSASAWAGACVYRYDKNGKAPESITTIGGVSSVDNNKLGPAMGGYSSFEEMYQGVPVEYRTSVRYLSDLTYTEASNTTNEEYPDGQPTALNAPYGATTGSFILGENETTFFTGLGVHPKNPKEPVNDSIESWTIYDVSDLNCDRFYSAIGLANSSAKKNSKGVVFRVYGEYGDSEYKLLAQSDTITGVKSGEFDVDITGVRTLRLAVICADTTHASSSSAWANACVYSTGEPKPLELPEESKTSVILPESTLPESGTDGAAEEKEGLWRSFIDWLRSFL